MKKVIFVGLIISFILAGAISYFASKSPDGLERVAEDKGFLDKGEGKGVVKSPLPDYSVPAIKSEFLSNLVSGIIGVILAFGVMLAAGYLIRRKKSGTRISR